ncbi:MAG: hypothetical protein RLZZ118_975 [Bacteroidota bacterium]|jgi:hypothetical protein
MKIYIFFIFVGFYSNSIYAQSPKPHINKYYVGGKLYGKFTYFIDPDFQMESYLEISNTQNYNSKNYFSCSGCGWQNNYKVNIQTFEDTKTHKNITLITRYISNSSCILIFQNENKDEDKLEVYLAEIKNE